MMCTLRVMLQNKYNQATFYSQGHDGQCWEAPGRIYGRMAPEV